MSDMPELGKAMREKSWDELDTDGKIQRMHQVVKGLRGDMARLHRTVRALERHGHKADGELVVPMRFADRVQDEASGSSRGGKEWF